MEIHVCVIVSIRPFVAPTTNTVVHPASPATSSSWPWWGQLDEVAGERLSGYVPMRLAVLPFVIEAVVTESTAVRTRAQTKEDSAETEEGMTSCDDHRSCPPSATCCLMASGQRWGCCPLPQVSCWLITTTIKIFSRVPRSLQKLKINKY